MELFYSTQMENGICILPEEESRHCIRVLRHVAGDRVNVIDGTGNLLVCRIMETGRKEVACQVEETVSGFGAHGYVLTMAVCPTKNIDRYEWFMEKATEMGVDVIVPVIGEHSERKAVKPERLEKILVSAAKQSLKGAVPLLEEALPVKEFIRSKSGSAEVKLIAYCGEQEKILLPEAVRRAVAEAAAAGRLPQISILIGPEGDFSKEEVGLAMDAGFLPLSLGSSRLRTETAAVAAVAGVYFGI